MHIVKCSNSFIWPVERTLSVTNTPGQSGLWGRGNEGVLHIPQRSRTDAFLSDGLESYPGHSLGGVSCPSAEMQLAYSTTSAHSFEFCVCFPLIRLLYQFVVLITHYRGNRKNNFTFEEIQNSLLICGIYKS